MAAALFIMLREGFEGALVVAVVLLYLKRSGRADARRQVWWGVALAVVVSAVVGVAVHQTVGGLEGAARARAFAAISLVAAGLLTWMIFWMRTHGRQLQVELETRTAGALDGGGGFRGGLVAVAFVAVLREGIEAALFLVAAAIDSSGAQVLAGAAIGTALALALAVAVYAAGKNLPVRTFFTVTGIVLIVFAAGLVSRAVLFLQGAGDVGSFNLNGVYDVRSITWLTQSSEVGKFLAALVGWDPRPSIEQVVVWFGYLIPVTVLFLRGPGSRRPGQRPAAAEASEVRPVQA